MRDRRHPISAHDDGPGEATMHTQTYLFDVCPSILETAWVLDGLYDEVDKGPMVVDKTSQSVIHHLTYSIQDMRIAS